MSMYIPASLAGGRYTVGNLIGHGGMAEVRIGTDTRLGRTVAIKIMRTDLASDPIFLTRFHREAHSVAQMNNSNIVSIYDSGEENIVDDAGRTISVPYLVMEYVQGKTLREILKENGALSQRDAEQVMIGVLTALEYSHRRGIIHRDIKPGNIMINDQGMVKVMDFGIARALDDSAATMTQAQGVVGTAQYLSPEQARGETVDMRSDLYSAGCVLYEMLTGRPPFTGDSAVAIAYQHVSEVATPPSAIVPGLPKTWDSICAKAMAKDRQNRYTTATEFRNDIFTLMNGGTPVAAAFNPLTDLTKDKAKNSGQATTVMPASGVTGSAGDGTGAGETVAFNPLADEAGVPETQTPNGANGPSRSEQRAETAKRKKRRLIIGTIIGIIAVIAIAAGVWFALGNGGDSTMVKVPTITEAMTRDNACSVIEEAGLQCQVKDDDDSGEEQGTFTKQRPKGGTQVSEGSTVTVWFSTGPKQLTVPDLKNSTQEAARKQLEQMGFTVNGTASVENSADVDKDMVTRTDPAAGTNQSKGTPITIYISSGMTEIPDGLEGLEQQEAISRVQAAGLVPAVHEESSSSVASGLVVRVNPSSGQQVEQGSSVTLYVSTGARQVSVPNVVGMTLDQARSALSDFTVQVATGSSSDGNAKVTNQDLAAGSQSNQGATITLTTEGGTDTEDSTTDTGNDNGSDPLGIVGKTQAEAKTILNQKRVKYVINGTGDDNATVTSVTQNADGSYTVTVQ